jgi:hypothetical protein
VADESTNTTSPSAGLANPSPGHIHHSIRIPDPFASTSRTSTFSSQTTTSATQTFGDTPQRPQRAPRPYAWAGGPAAGAAQPATTNIEDIQDPKYWRTLPVCLPCRMGAATERARVEANTSGAPPPSLPFPTTGPPGPEPVQFGQQPTTGMTAAGPDLSLGRSFVNDVFDNIPFFQNSNTAQPASRKRPASSSFTAQEPRTTRSQSALDLRQAELDLRTAELTLRAATLDTRENLLNRLEERLNTERREFEQRQQEANTASERARIFQISREAQAQAAWASRDATRSAVEIHKRQRKRGAIRFQTRRI